MIGRSKEQVYISTGYAGQGMTFGTVGAMLVSDLILGIPNPWAEVVDPMRTRPQVTTREAPVAHTRAVASRPPKPPSLPHS